MKLKNWIFALCVVCCTWGAVYGQTPQGAIPGVFSISTTKRAYFSQGALIHNGDTWSFTENQYNCPTEEQGGRFAWGTSGCGNPDTIPAGIGLYNGVFGNYADFDWGVYNPISNGGNQKGKWRTLKGEEWRYLYEHYDAERVTIEGVTGYKLLANDGEHDLFLPDGDYWASTSSSDLVGEQKTAEVCRVQETEGISLYGNALRTEKMMVRLVYETEEPDYLVVSDQRDNSPILDRFKEGGEGCMEGESVNVEVIRSLTTGMYNTLCLPFNLTAGEVKTAFGEDTQLAKFKEGTLSDDKKSLNVEFDEVDLSTEGTAIEAGVPYLIQPSQQVSTTHFYNRTIKLSAADGESFEATGAVQYLGIINPHKLEAGNKRYLFLQANNTLTWSKEGDTSTMKGMRGYFYVPAMEDMPTSCPARLSVRPAPQTPTGLVESQKSKVESRGRKFMYNGKLFIEYNGTIYSMDGGRL